MHLTPDEKARYERNGFLSPYRVFSESEAAALRQQVEAVEARAPAKKRAAARFSLPSIYPWAWDLVHDLRIVVPVGDILGPNVLLWSMDWFIKEPGASFVSYHQDATYWGLEPHHITTAWIALSDASAATGPMKFIPGTHQGPLYEQVDTFHADNMLSRGQRIRQDVDESRAVLAPLAAGEMSLHHVRVVHGSDPNMTSDRRIGMVLRYCSTDVRQTKVSSDQAVLVKGVDNYGHFRLIPRPEAEAEASAQQDRRELSEVRHRALHSADYESATANSPRSSQDPVD